MKLSSLASLSSRIYLALAHTAILARQPRGCQSDEKTDGNKHVGLSEFSILKGA
jgi:hypothetical protein